LSKEQPQQSAGQKLLAQSSHYSIASVFTLIGGLVSFPVLTRIFSVQDYGIMGIISATVSVAVALGKTGLQHAVVRYFAEVVAGKSRFTPRQLYSTGILGMLGAGAVVMVVMLVGSQLVPTRWIVREEVRVLLVFVSGLVLIQVIDSSMVNVLRADQRSVTLMKYTVLKKYLSLGCMFGGLLLISKSLRIFYTASVVAEGAALFVLAWIVLRSYPDRRPTPAQFSWPLYRELLTYGLPMTFGYELAGVILNVGDRYVIKGAFPGAEGETQLGLYSAAYNLCQYVQTIFVTSVGQALLPIYMKLFHEEGAEKTADFATQSLVNYVLVAAPLVAGVAAVGPDLLVALASERYAAAGGVLVWIMAGMVIDGAASIVGAGLVIHRRSTTMMYAVTLSAAVNVAANLILVPRWKIMGAAVATTIGYTMILLTFGFGARRLLPVRIRWKPILRAIAAAAIMYVALSFILPHRGWLTVAVRAVLGLVIYAGIIAAIDGDGRSFLASVLRRVRARLVRR
jgi:O-antigen/teichoic acid export membrane protein